MSTIKSFSVEEGDMFYINHGSDSFTIIDCCLPDEDSGKIVQEVMAKHADKGITRFISTHPDQDHLRGLTYLDDKIKIVNFYCVENQIIKEDETVDFKRYCALRDSDKAFYIKSGCSRRWINQSSEERGSAGVTILWPVIENEHYKEALEIAEEGENCNNVSAIIKYSLEGGATVLWMGDLETEFMEKIKNSINWPEIDILFAPHHGRDTGKIPESILEKLNPKLIIIGEAPSEELNYYNGYNTISQNSAEDIIFECIDKKVHIFVSNPSYSVDFLDNEDIDGEDYYLGTLNL